MVEINKQTFYSEEELFILLSKNKINNPDLFIDNLKGYFYLDTLLSLLSFKESVFNDVITEYENVPALESRTYNYKFDHTKKTFLLKGLFKIWYISHIGICIKTTDYSFVNGTQKKHSDIIFMVKDSRELFSNVSFVKDKKNSISHEVLLTLNSTTQKRKYFMMHYSKSEILDFSEKIGIKVNFSKVITYADKLSRSLESSFKLLGLEEGQIEALMNHEKSKKEIDENNSNENEIVEPNLVQVENKTAKKSEVKLRNLKIANYALVELLGQFPAYQNNEKLNVSKVANAIIGFYTDDPKKNYHVKIPSAKTISNKHSNLKKEIEDLIQEAFNENNNNFSQK